MKHTKHTDETFVGDLDPYCTDSSQLSPIPPRLVTPERPVKSTQVCVSNVAKDVHDLSLADSSTLIQDADAARMIGDLNMCTGQPTATHRVLQETQKKCYQDEMFAASFWAFRGHDRVITMMLHHTHDPMVQLYGCGTLVHLCQALGKPFVEDVVNNLYGHKRVIYAMNRHHSMLEVQESACSFLWEVTKHKDDKMNQKVIDAKGLEALLQALKYQEEANQPPSPILANVDKYAIPAIAGLRWKPSYGLAHFDLVGTQ